MLCVVGLPPPSFPVNVFRYFFVRHDEWLMMKDRALSWLVHKVAA